MNVDTYPDQVIGQTVDDATRPTFPVGKARKLAIGVVESVGADMEQHAGDIHAQIAIVVEVSRDHSQKTAEEAHCWRRHFQLLEEGRQVKADFPVKADVDPAFEFARLVCRFDCGRGARRKIDRHF